MDTALGAIAFVFLLLFAIFFHELGHFATARWAGIKVRQFFVGFGPTLWSFRGGRPEVHETDDGELVERPETEYGIKALPLGGFVKITGMSMFEDVPPEDAPRAFNAAPTWKRAVVLVAGSVTHFITAFVLLVVIFSALGLPGAATLTVSDVSSEPLAEGVPAPARAAGLREGDRIVSVDGRRVADWEAFRETIRENPDEPLTLTIRRDGRMRRLQLTPAALSEGNETVGVIGASPARETVRVNPITGMARAGLLMGEMLVRFVDVAPDAFSPRNLFSGDQPSDERAISVYGAGRIAAGLAAEGELVLFLFFFVNVNFFIGVLNLLPLPPLDGGHLLVLGIEKVRGKPVDQRKVLPIMAVVTTLLIMLGVALIIQDIIAPIPSPFG